MGPVSDVSDELELIPGTSGTVSRVTGGIFPVFADEGGERSAPQEHIESDQPQPHLSLGF